MLPWHSGTIHRRHHKLGYRVCQHTLVHVLEERTGRCRKIGYCSNMRRKTWGNWTPWCYILLYCQQTLWSLMLVHYHCLPILNYASWLPCHCWTQDSQRQHNCWEEIIFSIQITADCWAASGAWETRKESSSKSNFYRWTRWMHWWRYSSRSYRNNCILRSIGLSWAAPNLA